MEDDMPQFLKIAEKVYKKLKEEKEFTHDPIENLNKLIIEIRKEIKDTSLKLLYNFIDFEECLNKPVQECKVKLDISLIPMVKNEDEFILWLAGFIEHITIDDKKYLSTTHKETTTNFKFTIAQDLKKNIFPQSSHLSSSEQINSYFLTDEFIETFNKSH